MLIVQSKLFIILSTVLITLSAVVILYATWQYNLAGRQAASTELTDQYLNDCVTSMLETGMLKIEQLPGALVEPVASESVDASASAGASSSADER